MGLQEDQTETISGTDAIIVEAGETLSQDWMNVESEGALADTINDDRPQFVGTIPSFLLEEEKPSKKRFYQIGALRKTSALAVAFALGCVAASTWFNMQTSPSDSPGAGDIVCADNDADLQVGQYADENSTAQGSSFNFDAFDSNAAVQYDDVYGSNLSQNDSVVSFSSSSTASGFEDFQSAALDVNGAQEDSFPTWADLAPREEADVNPDARSPEYVAEQINDYPQYQPEVPARNNLPEETQVPLFDGQNIRDSFLSQTNSIPQEQTAAQGFQDFQSVNSTSYNYQNDYSNYNNNVDYTKIANKNSTANSKESVDELRDADYNNYQDNNDYARNSVAQDQNGFGEIADSGSPYARQPEPALEPAVTGPLYDTTQDEEETPAYVSSIPTFDNPRPERDERSRKAYVAQNYDGSNRQTKNSSAPQRSVRW